MNVKVTSRDNGLDALLKRLSRLEVTAGVHMEEGSEPEDGSPLTVAEIAAIHEFGMGVPERSWLRDFVDDNREKLLDMLQKSGTQVIKGMDPDLAMNRFGLAVVGMIKERIIAGIDPPLKDATKKQKQRVTGGGAKDTPLIRFGQFIGAITHELNTKT